MKPGQIIMFVLVTAAFLAGCGQKGPLYREAPAENDTASEQASDDKQGRNEDTDNR